ncbi:MAG: GNAT family N-acetyltransferase [Ignavibacteria bacterium]|nr:GNAT family N-acetyltransferase [Ignavibacteria bacterium]
MNITLEPVFRQVTDDEQLTRLSELAHRIWNMYYPDIIGQKQVDYMLGKMYSLGALKEQISNGHTFVAGYVDGKMVGFLSYSKTSEMEYMIHKWYVDVSIHGKGVGRKLFDAAFVKTDYDVIRLTVNRQNFKAVNFYFRFGFTIERVADFDIGDGFFMNDFVMILKKPERK